jgi:hypothetical protein
MNEHRVGVETLTERPVSRIAVLVIITIWIAAAAALGWFLYAAAAPPVNDLGETDLAPEGCKWMKGSD